MIITHVIRSKSLTAVCCTGVRVALTTNGGSSWNVTMLSTDPEASGMSAAWIGEKEVLYCILCRKVKVVCCG